VSQWQYIEAGDLIARISFDDTGLNKPMAAINRQMQIVQSEFQKAFERVIKRLNLEMSLNSRQSRWVLHTGKPRN